MQEASLMSSLVLNRSSFPTRLKLFARRSLLADAAVLSLVTAPFVMVTPAAVQAAEPWQQSCAYKTQFGVLGSGMGIAADYCTRLTFCQRMAEQNDPNMAQKGCFGFAPQAASVPVSASKYR
ncbi:hypothetical protein [Bosea sp. BIWAKO-01]|uniref:hypothetical protein n=1 Tax=Bosea sp. BIWAKO-01 TaxID=506668 RepID=UPI00114CEFD4|nr:hypothetical protein [Bosea sp. BIWAKO-01]